MDKRIIAGGATILMIGVVLYVFTQAQVYEYRNGLLRLEWVIDEEAQSRYNRLLFIENIGMVLIVLGPLIMIGGSIREGEQIQRGGASFSAMGVGAAIGAGVVLCAIILIPQVANLMAHNETESHYSGEEQEYEDTYESEKESEEGSGLSGEHPSITLQGPATAGSGDTIVLSVKNTGNVVLTRWWLSGPISNTGGPLTIGSQRSFSTTLTGSGPWTFQVEAETQSGKTCSDALTIK